MKTTYVVITRPESDSEEFITRLKQIGLQVHSLPSITITKNPLSEAAQKELRQLDTFDWVLFTSRNGVRFFMEALRDLQIDPKIVMAKKIGTVGPKTADEAERYNLPIHIIPTQFANEYLGQAIKNIEGKKILLPRSDIANLKLTRQLQAKGAVVIDIPIYKTQYSAFQNIVFDKLVMHSQIVCLTFTSPSTVNGFMQNVNEKIREEVLSLPALCIGPITAKAAKKYGFKKIYTAKIFTTEGMISKLQESIL